MPMTSQMRKEASPPPNKPFHRIGGKRRPPPGDLFVNDYICYSSARHAPEHGLSPSDYDTKLIASLVEEAFTISKIGKP
jgi:hypothetical protein